jgi:hypothetical protein
VNLNPDLVPLATEGRTVISDLGVLGQNVLDRNLDTNLEGVPGVYVQISPRVISPVDAPVSRYKHIWDRGRAAGRPRVVFVEKSIHPLILRPSSGVRWAGTIRGDRRSFASVAASPALRRMALKFGRGGRGWGGYTGSRPNFTPRRPLGGYVPDAFEQGGGRQQ